MTARSVTRAWTIASWRVGIAGGNHRAVVDVLEELDADVIALQAIRLRDARAIADTLDHHHHWSKSHYPSLRVIPGSAVGLAVLTPHRISAIADTITGDRRTLWSSDRRIAQTATILRSDHSAYAITHRSSTDPVPMVSPPETPAPLITISPALPTSGGHPDVALPGGATGVTTEITSPFASAPPLVVKRFAMVWVQGDFAAS